MKIEKVSENQIRCTLTKQDLVDRQINVKEFVYGSDKAKGLFRDMIQQANYEFGFETDDTPLMVEAIPLSSESLILLITKVEYPEELDPRFSQFSEQDDDLAGLDELMDRTGLADSKGADDVLGIFNKIREEQENLRRSRQQEAPGADQTEDEASGELTDLIKMFEFSNMEQVQQLARILSGYYDGVNDLYKNERQNHFFLMIHKSGHSPEEFNKVCNMICEYAVQRNYTAAIGAYYEEHGKPILQGNALQTIAEI